MHKLLLTISCVLVLHLQGISQTTILKGKVVEKSSGEGLPGVSIIIKGTRNGTITDFDGNYSLSLENPTEQTLIYSFIGFVNQEIPVGSATSIDVSLIEDETELDEVIVTALGITQNKRAMNYAVQDIKAESIAETEQQNIVNALQGKIAGVQITSSSGSPGSSSSIVIRGGSSVGEGRSNEPLFVIDGIIIDNSTFQGSGNRAVDINPNDIASMTVLKGPGAAALYGIRAANGAVVITTKSGKAGRVSVVVGATVAFDRAFRPIEVQTTYARGNNGLADLETRRMWGPAYVPGDQIYDNIGEFFQTGVQQKYDFSVSGGSEKGTFFLSASNNHQTGIIPGEEYSRLNVLLKGSTKITDRLTVTSSVSSILSDNLKSLPGSMQSVYTWPTDNQMSDYLTPDGQRKVVREGLDNPFEDSENPYWNIKNNLPEYDINRTIGQIFFDWELANSLTATYRIGMDRSNQYFRQVTAAGSFGSEQRFNGAIRESEQDRRNITSTLNLTFSKMLNQDWNISVLAGANADLTSVRSTTFEGTDFLLPNLTSINNTDATQMRVRQNNVKRRVVGIYSEAKLDYKGIASISITGRNDKTSTITPGENSFFYPSFTGGFVFTELLPTNITNIFSFGKLRASWAASGADAGPESLGVVLEQFPGYGNGYKHDFFAGNEFLIPERQRSIEFGGHLTFLNGRFDLDVARYKIEALDMIVQTRISTASGWVIQTFNSGNTVNKGWELVFEADVLRQGPIKWSAIANFSANRSELTELPSFISRYPVTSGQIINEARPQGIVGRPLYAIEGVPYLRNENGSIVISEDGFPRSGTYLTDADGAFILNSDGSRKVSQENVYLGNREPDWLLGITNEFAYKNFSLSFLIDIRKGGDIINATASAMFSSGLHKSLEENRNKVMVFDGEVETADGFKTNDQQVVLDDDYFQFTYRTVGENFVEDGSWLKLRYIALTYSFTGLAERVGMERLDFTATGRNLFMLAKYSGGDPEKDFQGSAVGGPGTTGLDNFNVPTTQGLTFTLRATL